MGTFEGAIGRLRSAGWTFVPAPGDAAAAAFTDTGVSPSVADWVPDTVGNWISSFAQLASADDTTWFLSATDFADSRADAFAWNEFETLSAEAAATTDERAQVTAFWSRHLPLLQSVRGHYAYLAVRADGAIVHGEEPEFERTTVVAAHLDELLRRIADGPSQRADLIDALLFPSA